MHRNTVHRLFLKFHPEGPYICYFCRKEVTRRGMHIHHIDHDVLNNSESNLVSCHPACHARHHHPGQIPGGGGYNSGSFKPGNIVGRTAFTGKQHTKESKAKMSEARKKWWERKRV